VDSSYIQSEVPIYCNQLLPNVDTDWAKGAVFIVNKPYHWTSFRVVGLIRKLIGIKKVGHAGTLDPLATGVLIVCVGKATKQIDTFMVGSKVYRAGITFGASTPSYDSETDINQTCDYSFLNDEIIKRVIDDSFTGEISQIPPMYSAVKHKGTPLYKMARQGKEIERKPRSITIHSTEIVSYEPPVLNLNIHCSKGTYIRTFAHELGLKLGTLAHLSGLERTKSGSWSVDMALEVNTLLKYLDPHGKTGINL
jgi:tRNA pseudouridine55 synthase